MQRISLEREEQFPIAEDAEIPYNVDDKTGKFFHYKHDYNYIKPAKARSGLRISSPLRWVQE